MLQAFRVVATPSDTEELLHTMRAVNAACTWIGGRAFALQSADKLRLRRETYGEARRRFGLPAQLAVLAISKVCEAYRRERSHAPRFDLLDAVPFDRRLYSFRLGPDRLSLTTLRGRLTLPVVHAAYFGARPDGASGQADLVVRHGCLLFFTTVDLPDDTVVPMASSLPADVRVRNRTTEVREGSGGMPARLRLVPPPP